MTKKKHKNQKSVMIPNKKQWKKWTLPSKLTAIGAYLAIITFALYIYDKMSQSKIDAKVERIIKQQNLLFTDDVQLDFSITIKDYEEMANRYISELDSTSHLKRTIQKHRNFIKKNNGRLLDRNHEDWFSISLTLPLNDILIENPEILIQCGNNKTFLGSLETKSGQLKYQLSMHPHGEYHSILGEQILEISNGIYGKSIYELCNRDSHLYIDFDSSVNPKLSSDDYEIEYIEITTSNRKQMIYEFDNTKDNNIIRSGKYNHYTSYRLTNNNCWYEKIDN